MKPQIHTDEHGFKKDKINLILSGFYLSQSVYICG